MKDAVAIVARFVFGLFLAAVVAAAFLLPWLCFNNQQPVNRQGVINDSKSSSR